MNVHHLLTRTAIRSIEAAAAPRLAPGTLMRRAAQAAERLVNARWPSQQIVILCGPGNNGGDGAMLAELLRRDGRSVKVWRLTGRHGGPADAETAWLECAPGLLQQGDPATAGLPDDTSILIVDALFGIGLARPLSEDALSWTRWANAHPADVLALDIPSGLDADSGAAQPYTIVASATLSFIADKPGLRMQDGIDRSGHVIVDTLGLDTTEHAEPATHGSWIHGDFPEIFAPRAHNTHKGSFGTLAILGGAPGMTGAALLAGRAALRSGAGKVLLGLAETGAAAPACDVQQPELMLRRADDMLAHAHALGVTAWIAGCGLGDSAQAAAWLERLLGTATDAPLVLDADALALLAREPGLADCLARRGGPRVLTPHPREASRMLACDTAAVQADRIGSARELAARFGAWTVLKGAGTVVAAPDGTWSVNGSGNPGLATAGTGDVLAGMIGALLAQRVSPATAVRGGVWLHGAAADELVRQGIGPIGMTAGELIDAARHLRNRAHGAAG